MKMKRYTFYLITDKGAEIRWPGLTLTQARNMYKWAQDAAPLDVRTYGWEEMP
jgi:hypothetical protein